MSKSIADRKVVTIKRVVDSFLLSCKVEGKSYGTIECYADKLKRSPLMTNVCSVRLSTQE